VSQDALARLLASRSDVRDASVTLVPGRVMLSAIVFVLGASVPAAAEGRLSLRGSSGVDLILDRLTVAGVGLPEAVRNQVAGDLNPILDARSLPFGMRLVRVQVDEGRVTLDAMAGGQ
jgi:hypothetical protein